MSKIAYLGKIQLSDVDLSYLHEAQKLSDVTLIMEVTPRFMRGPAFNIATMYPKSGVFKAVEAYPEFQKYADFIANAPDDDPPESDEERELKVSIHQTVRKNIDRNSKNTERFEKMYELDRKLCTCRKSHAIDIVKCDPSFRFRYDANAFRKHYYNGSVFDGNMDYNKFVAALRKLSSDILRHANSIKDAQ